MTPRAHFLFLAFAAMAAVPARLVDAGDAWRALLLGAPPILL